MAMDSRASPTSGLFAVMARLFFVKANSVKLTFGKNNLAITANSPEVGEARESMAVNYKGKEMAIAFNPKYMIDPLNALTNDEVFIELIDELSPGVLKINGPFLYVVMPMRLS